MPRRYVGQGVFEDVPAEGDTAEEKTAENSLDIAIEDVATRFLTNLPSSELESADRLMFQIEQAHWYYEDFLADAAGAQLPHMNLRTFAQHLFARCALLKPLVGVYEELFNNFRAYKGHIPVCGLALLDKSMTKLVLVRNWQKTSWGLPKGKLNQNESTRDCAIREVYEETGFDASNKDVQDEDAIFFVADTQPVHLFIVPDVPLDFPFKPRVRKEISAVAFFPLDHLPKEQWKVDRALPHLRRWIKRRRKQLKKSGTKSRATTTAPPSKSTTPILEDTKQKHETEDQLIIRLSRPNVIVPPPVDFSKSKSPPFQLDCAAVLAAFDAALPIPLSSL